MKQTDHDLSFAIDALTTAVTNLTSTLTKARVETVSSTDQVDLTRSVIDKLACYSVFPEWKRNSVETQWGLIFAPNNFYTSDEQEKLFSRFSWDEAKIIEEILLKPAGWRLPTMNEWGMVIKYARKDQELFSTINLCREGWIPKPCVIAELEPQFAQYSLGRDFIGAYWSSTACNDSEAYCYIFDKNKHAAITPQDKECGLSIRCVLNDN